VAADADGLCPVGDEARDVVDDDGLAEYGAADDVADGAVGRFVHFFESEFFDARFVGGDGCAFDADSVLVDGVGSVDGDLVVGFVAALDAEVVVFDVDVEVGKDQFFFDEFPDYSCHFVAVKLDNGFGYFYFSHV